MLFKNDDIANKHILTLLSKVARCIPLAYCRTGIYNVSRDKRFVKDLFFYSL